jgi:hypothetical protein
MISLFDNESGKKLASVILGLGLAAMFREICYKENCIVIKGPNSNKIEEMKDTYYRIGNNCYKYNTYSINCPKKKDKKEKR